MKNKILNNLPGIWVILVFTLGLLLISKQAQTNEHPVFPDGVMTTQQIPIFCGYCLS